MTTSTAREIDRVLRHALRSQSAPRIHAMIDLARSEPGIAVEPTALDRDPWLLNCPNGTLDLRTGNLRPHDPADMITKLSGAPYDPGATCPRWESFLARVMDGNQDLVGYLQRAVGYSLTADVGEQCLFFLHGGGANGKSVFLAAVQHVLGEYGGTAAPDLLLARHGERHPTELADLHGRRFVCTVEVEDGRRLAETLVKQLTGGDRVKARGMRENFFEFPQTWKIWLAANAKPIIHGQDYAIWRRIRLIPFTVTIPEAERDKGLPEKLKAEAPGILAWAVRGCLDWQRGGLREPEAVLAATKDYMTEMDVIGRFVAERCVIGPRHEIGATQLYQRFLVWLEMEGEKRVITQTRFGRDLARLVPVQKARKNGIVLIGVTVEEEAKGTERLERLEQLEQFFG